jgi:ABC-type transport system involved in cytochrome bd biosynthesis fused ATPase/permease subunit
MEEMMKSFAMFALAFVINMWAWLWTVAQHSFDEYGGQAISAVAIFGALIAALKIVWEEMKKEREARIAAEQRAAQITEAMSDKLAERMKDEIESLKRSLRAEAEEKAAEHARHIDRQLNQQGEET